MKRLVVPTRGRRPRKRFAPTDGIDACRRVAGRGRLAAMLVVAILAATSPRGAARAADTYPDHTVRILVGFAPGGSVDLMARLFAKKLGERLGKAFIVENRPGAGGNIGANVVAKAAPDGYTLLMTSVVHSINPSLYRDLPFDAVKDFAPVGPVALAPNAIAVPVDSRFHSLDELVRYAKAHPHELSFSSAGGGTLMYLGMALFETMAGIEMLHVPYNGTGPSIQAVIGGSVDVLSSGYGSAEPFVKGGKLRMLGISTASRVPMAPGIPTIAEAASLKGYEVVGWIGLLAPAGTPPAVIERLNAAIGAIEQLPEVQTFLPEQGLEPYFLDPSKFREVVVGDIRKYRAVVDATGAHVD